MSIRLENVTCQNGISVDMNYSSQIGAIEFFRIELYRIHRICRILILVILKIKTTNDSILQILKIL